MKKKILLLIVLFLLSLQMIGCDEADMRHGTVYTTERANLMNEKIIECINNEDSDGLVSLFSKKNQADMDDLSEQANMLIASFDGKKIAEIETDHEPGFSGADYAQPLEISGIYDFTLDTEEQYRLHVNFIDIYDDHPECVGINNIKVFNCPYEEVPDDFDWDAVRKERYGIFFYKIK